MSWQPEKMFGLGKRTSQTNQQWWQCLPILLVNYFMVCNPDLKVWCGRSKGWPGDRYDSQQSIAGSRSPLHMKAYHSYTLHTCVTGIKTVEEILFLKTHSFKSELSVNAVMFFQIILMTYWKSKSKFLFASMKVFTTTKKPTRGYYAANILRKKYLMFVYFPRFNSKK